MEAAASRSLSLFHRQEWEQSMESNRHANGGSVIVIRFIVKRIALLLAVLLAVNAATYLVTNYLQLRGPMAYNYVPDTRVSIAEVFAPYPDYLRGMLHGDLGVIGIWRRAGEKTPILGYIVSLLPKSLVLLGIAVLLSIVIGIGVGFLSVNYKTHRTNSLALIFSLAGFSMPGFYMGILILYLIIWAAMTKGELLFSLPVSGYGLDEHLVLPILTLSARPTAEIARLTTELLSEELPKEYIRTARAKGLPERVIVVRHAFRNVVAAVINAMSNSWSYLIGSLVIIERVFYWGGIGEALIDAVTFNQFAGSYFNPALVAGLATALASLFLLADLITGLVAQTLDPRLRRVHREVA
jgi:peptide/nickel transport system permease protein